MGATVIVAFGLGAVRERALGLPVGGDGGLAGHVESAELRAEGKIDHLHRPRVAKAARETDAIPLRRRGLRRAGGVLRMGHLRLPRCAPSFDSDDSMGITGRQG